MRAEAPLRAHGSSARPLRRAEASTAVLPCTKQRADEPMRGCVQVRHAVARTVPMHVRMTAAGDILTADRALSYAQFAHTIPIA